MLNEVWLDSAVSAQPIKLRHLEARKHEGIGLKRQYMCPFIWFLNKIRLIFPIFTAKTRAIMQDLCVTVTRDHNVYVSFRPSIATKDAETRSNMNTACGSKISSKSLYLARFSRYKHFYVLQFCEKLENSKWPPFLARNFFFENWHGYSAEIPCGSKISSKSLYLAGF